MMGSTPRPPEERPSETAGLSAHLLALLASLAAYFGARLELAGLEGKEALGTAVKAGAVLGAGCLCLCFGYAFLWVGAITLLSTLFPFHWGWWVLAAGGLHLLAAIGCAAVAAARWKKPFFPATLEEFRKDEEWLKNRQ
ncbi:MAG: phage holin family protein [Chthoniobacteraceae bacterium]|nr:phage holin family protein [Chthoniobacteraceae bacterium]